MSTQGASLLSSSSSSSRRWIYDVFLSFRGEDTRNSFTDHLYAALQRSGFSTFRDNEKLEGGKSIKPELLKAIEESRFAIVILSRNYASSTWCLDELAKIIQCMKEMKMTVLPIFYKVDPSDVRNQKGTFAQAFAKHEKHLKGNAEKVQTWQAALSEVANLSGWHSQERPEAEVIEDVVKVILNQLSYTVLIDTKEIVGITSRVEKLMSHLAIESNGVRLIGIWGAGGMGKTTLARVVYKMIFNQFEACSFISNVREVYEKYGILQLQQTLWNDLLTLGDIKVKDVYNGVFMIKNRLCHKKILLVLDDVNELDQLNKLIAKRDWLGPGSRVIITTRDVHLLMSYEVDDIYEAEGLSKEEALHLFNSKAFDEEHPPKDYLELCQGFVDYANGLPLTIEVLGSLLYGRSTIEWKSVLDRLKEFPERKVLDVLRISFDALDEREREIFLHIACFFNYRNKETIIAILDCLGLYPEIGLRALIDKSLIKLQADQLWMHDLLQEMGRDIVHIECPKDPGKRSRLWMYKDIDSVLTKNTGTKAIQGIVLTLPELNQAHWDPSSFSKMHRLKFLIIENFHLMYDPKHLPNDLRFLDWSGYTSKSLPTSFQPNELIELHMCFSNIEQLWTGTKSWEMLKKLTVLNLKGCKNLKSLSRKFEMESLKILILSGCSKIKTIPEFGENMGRVTELYLDGTAITKLPTSIGNLSGLASLNVRDCKNLMFLPSIFFNMTWLKDLNLGGCSKLLHFIPMLRSFKSMGLQLSSLRELNLSNYSLKEIPNNMVDLAAMVPFHPVDQKDKGSQPSPSQLPHDRLSWVRKEARWKALHDQSYLARKEVRWRGRLNLNPLQLFFIDRGLKMSRKLESLPMMMDWGIKLPSQMRVMMLPSQMRAIMNLDSQMRAIGETEEVKSPRSSTKLKRLESSSLTIYRGIKLPWEEIEDCESPHSSTKWKRLYLKIVESEINEAESLPSELLAGPSERNKLYFFFWHAYSPVMYSLYEVDVPIPLPPPPSKADQDDRIINLKSLSPILQLKTGKYADGMCCVQLGSILYFLGGEMNIDNPYIDEDVKEELKNVEPDVLPKIVYIFDLAIDREVKVNYDLLTSTPMNYGKASPLAFVADEKIYVIGSTIRDLEVNRIPYFEMFDPKVDKWSVLENPPEINVNTIWVGHAVVGRKALLVGWRQKKKHLYCFDLDTCEWASISIPDYVGNFSGNTEFVGNTFYGCYYDTVAAIAPLVGEEKDELKEEEEEEQEEAEEKDFQQMFKHHRLLQVSKDLGMDAIFNVPPQLQYSSSLLHLGKMYFCYVRTGMPPHPNPILADDLVIGDDKKRFISVVIFQASGKTCNSRFFRAKFLHSEHYVVDSPFPNDGFIRGCYVFGSGSTESSKQISI